MQDRPLKILLLASEAVPFVKTGGLADVIGSLPKALAVTVNDDCLINDVRVAIPCYKGVEKEEWKTDFAVPMDKYNATAIIRESRIEAHLEGRQHQIPVYLVDNYHYFDRQHLYQYPDEAERFIFWNKAVLAMLPRLDWKPDIIHLNDWQCGPLAFFLKTKYADHPFYQKISTVFTIHNLQYQGNFGKENLPFLEVGEEWFNSDNLEFYHRLNFMKMGILYSDLISTVSRTYAAEIQRPEKGEKLDGLLRRRSSDLFGIVNGINYHEFNPQTDKRIYRNYSWRDLENKKENKYALQKQLKLPVKACPVLALICRLTSQKGLDLLGEIAEELMHLDLQLLILGEGEEKYQALFRHLQEHYPQKVYFYQGFNSILAQRIYAGADMFLMPSLFEPCGLSQMIAMRYGTIPIVRSTGGLADTVHDYNPVTGSGNGFVFKEFQGRALYHALARAIKLWRDSPVQWQKLIERGMETDFSWARSGVEYLELYQEAIARHLGQRKLA